MWCKDKCKRDGRGLTIWLSIFTNVINSFLFSCANIQIYFYITKQKQIIFCFYIKIFCFIYYIYVRRKARTQANTLRPLQAGEMGTPVTICAASRHEQPRRTTSGRTTTATPSPTIWKTSCHEQPQPERHQGHTPTATPSPPGFRIYDKLNLTASIPMGHSSAAADAQDENVQNTNSL